MGGLKIDKCIVINVDAAMGKCLVVGHDLCLLAKSALSAVKAGCLSCI